MSEHPFLADEFHIRWSLLTPERVEIDINTAISKAEANLAAICAVAPGSETYENTFAAFDEASNALDRGWGRLNHLDSVRNSDEQREALNQMLPTVSAFSASVPLNAALWKVLRAYADSDHAKSLDPVRSRYVEETCAYFRDAGADLPADKKERIAEIQSKLSAVTQKFTENVLDSTNAWSLVVDDPERLKGLPQSAIDAAKADAASKDLGSDDDPRWRFTLQYTSLGPVFQYADDESLRHEVFEGNTTVGKCGKHDNTNLIWEILALRQEKAELLDCANFADLVLQRRMAKNGQTALDFSTDLHDRIVKAFDKECQELQDYKAEKTSTPSAPLEPWDSGYWAEKRRKELFDFDEEELRPYFSVQKVMAGLFDIASRIYGITITSRDSACGDNIASIETWDPEVTFYDLHDSNSKEHLGSFYADWHPRESKRNGAWMNHLKTGLPAAGDKPRTPHLGLICGNMTKPVGDKPALLTHREVETIFHEFGHLVHHLLSDVPVKGLAGVNVAWDFVELPSQIMENFCWDRESLDLFARHHETDEPIPDDLFAKLIAARNYMSASTFMRQLALGRLDLMLHIHLADYKGRDLDEAATEILQGYQATLASRPPSMARRFTHLFGDATGYAAGYYSYKWAEVLDADAFTRFQKDGPLNPNTGRAFRDCILSKGNSDKPNQLYRNFMGRDPELEPLLVRSGLA